MAAAKAAATEGVMAEAETAVVGQAAAAAAAKVAAAERVMAEADVNGDGQISYAEFVPVAVDLVQAAYAKADAAAQLEAEADKAGEDARDYLLHGMSKEELERTMKQIFNKADADGSGSLSLDEFHKCLGQADLGLTRQEIHGLMQEVDTDGRHGRPGGWQG